MPDLRTDDRRTDIEEQLAHLQRTVEELSDIIAAQDRRIELLERRAAMLMAREAERVVDETGTLPLADQRPPHW